jgi:hypothetical protein
VPVELAVQAAQDARRGMEEVSEGGCDAGQVITYGDHEHQRDYQKDENEVNSKQD